MFYITPYVSLSFFDEPSPLPLKGKERKERAFDVIAFLLTIDFPAHKKMFWIEEKRKIGNERNFGSLRALPYLLIVEFLKEAFN